MNYHHQIIQKRGSPTPLGASKQDDGINFALFSEAAHSVILHLFFRGEKKPFVSFHLNPRTHKTGQIWHIHLVYLDPVELEYSYQLHGDNHNPLNRFQPDLCLSDPYALGLNTSHRWGHKEEGIPRSRVILDKPFDWEGILSPQIPLEDLVIYEMHTRTFTIDPQSHTHHPGTFLALIEKIPYLKSLGVNAIELMPIFEFNENELKGIDPTTQNPLKNVWGYSTINFFAPMNRFASSEAWTGAIDEFRTLVKELHRHGMEVYLDVVYNHTAEGDETGPTYSFRGIDNKTYYLLKPDGEYLNFSGTGNTLNANHPVVAELILSSLRYWVKEMHVDGFRFDLASCLTRDKQGKPSSYPLVIQMITSDPLLANVKLIAEAWDAAGLYQVGHFPGDERWLEWNGRYRDNVRQFIKGTDNQSGPFAKSLCGSQELFASNRTPLHSVNFVVAHDGYTLYDLVSYQDKHNLANAEDNRDGCSHNLSWNSGWEGETKDEAIRTLRKRQMRNFHVALMISIGTPMLLMGDEYAHTKQGNNNTYCQDNKLNWFLWNRLKEDEGWSRFYTKMIHFRKTHPVLKRTTFLTDQDVFWHGLIPLKPNWSESNRFVAYTLIDPLSPLYIAFNAGSEGVTFQLPELPSHQCWYRIVDTSLPSPNDFLDTPMPLSERYSLSAYSSFVAKAL